MAVFLTDKELEEKITDIIFHAKKTLLILSPYIKLDNYFKSLFTNHIKNPDVHIKIIFGKNQDNKGRSLSKADFDFFKQFPNISILYLKDLHAKYYANEIEGVITSINLYDYSFKNNIEFGVSSKTNEEVLGGVSVANPFSDNLDRKAWEKSFYLINSAEVVFIKRPIIQKRLFGLTKNHLGSEICYDNIDFFTRRYGKKETSNVRFGDFPDAIEYGKARFEEKPNRNENSKQNLFINSSNQSVKEPIKQNIHQKETAYSNRHNGFCIRTGERIHYNPNYPFSDIAYNSWRLWQNEDYQENYCHSCGLPNKTSKRRPLCDNCYFS